MFWSRSDFFRQTPAELVLQRKYVFEYLKLKGYWFAEINIYLNAFDYFSENPEKFDGATIVKDLIDIPGLDLDAMLHDYMYIVYNVSSSFYTKWKADWLYAKGQERKGKGQYSSFSRFIGLTVIGIGFVPYCKFKRGSIKNDFKTNFLKDYQTLLHSNY